MQPLKRQSLIEQVAGHLRRGVGSGQWQGRLPGVQKLAAQLEVSKDTVRAAFTLLEKDGTLKPQGAGRCRVIPPAHRAAQDQRRLRMAILLPVPLRDDNAHSHRLILGIQNAIEADGHACTIVTQPADGHLRRVTQLVMQTEADAWVVYAGSHDLLKWFATKRIPALALGGRPFDLPLARSRTVLVEAMIQCVDALVGLGHRRMVLIAPQLWRQPTPNHTAEALLSRLALHSIPSSEYNLPAWSETPEGLEDLLKALFFATPPTALLLAEPMYCSAVRAWLGEHGLHVPRDVSLVNLLPDPMFQLHQPAYTGFIWPESVHIHRIQRWLRSLLSGEPDLEDFVAFATFHPGGTIGPAKGNVR
ncbi:MAG: substrate-binding domain-containing protein [Verrucomicrobiota bacterium]